jgi:crotonobetainyl-CoA:carnitine CoA-transferase CaiB-like acyl-CoA transferase
MAPPLTGLKVVDFTRVIAGPVAAMILSDLGAEIVKLEHPKGGDDTRGYRPPEYKGISAAFLSYNRGKQSVAIDLATEAGCKAARALVDQADVVIENFSTGVMAKYGLDYDSVKRPELVYCSTSAYGRDGPFMKRPGYDPVVQAESGFQSLTGHADSEPVRTAIPMTDVTTGLNGAMAILAALWRRKKTGLGQFVEVPLYDTGLFNTAPLSVQRMAGGPLATRIGNGDHWAAPANRYVGSDGQALVAVADTDARFEAMMETLELAAPLHDARFKDGFGRLQNRTELDDLVSGAVAKEPAADWVDRLRTAGVPAALVRELPESIPSIETSRRGVTGMAPHSVIDEAPELGPAMRLKRRGLKPAEAAPLLGQDGAAVLQRWLGYGPDELAAVGIQEDAS